MYQITCANLQRLWHCVREDRRYHLVHLNFLKLTLTWPTRSVTDRKWLWLFLAV